MPLSTPSLLLLLLQKLLPYNSWHHMLVVLLESISEIMASMLSSSMTICPSKPWHTDKCHCFWEDHPVERPIQVMCFISILVSLKEQLRWIKSTVVVPSLLYQLLRPKLVMCQLIFQQMWSQLLTVRSSWKLSFSIRVSDQPLTSVYLCPESVLQLKLRLWNKSPVL